MATNELKKNNLTFEDFEPAHELQELPDKFILLLKLPEFKKEDFRVELDDSIGNLKVQGQKQIDENKFERFNEVIPLPMNSDVEKITGKFEEGILTLTLPKKVPKGKPKTNSEKEEESLKLETEIKEAACRINNAINKWKQSRCSETEEKKIVCQKARIGQQKVEQTKGWSDYASFINSTKVIVVGVAALSIGFLVTCKLSSRK